MHTDKKMVYYVHPSHGDQNPRQCDSHMATYKTYPIKSSTMYNNISFQALAFTQDSYPVFGTCMFSRTDLKHHFCASSLPFSLPSLLSTISVSSSPDEDLGDDLSLDDSPSILNPSLLSTRLR